MVRAGQMKGALWILQSLLRLREDRFGVMSVAAGDTHCSIAIFMQREFGRLTRNAHLLTVSRRCPQLIAFMNLADPVARRFVLCEKSGKRRTLFS